MRYLLSVFFLFAVIFQSLAQDPEKPGPGADTTKAGKPTGSNATANILAQTNLTGIIPSSPEVASLGKYIDTPISYYTGTPTISIPIYNIKNADLELPISISYHGGGIRVEEEASQVGLGFAMNASPVIRHQIRGRDDMLSDGSKWLRLKALVTAVSGALCINLGQGGYGIFNASGAGTGGSGPANGNELADILANMQSLSQGEPTTDGELDLFSYNVAGYSGKFVVEPLGAGQYAARTLSNDAVKVKIVGATPANWNFVLTFPNGNVYTFGQREYQKVSYPNLKVTMKSKDPNYFGPPYSGGVTHVSAWYATKLTSAHRLATDAITFSYTVGAYVGQLPTGTETYFASTAGGASSDPNFRWKVTEVQSQEITLDQISFTNGKVKFFRSSRLDRPAGSLKLDRIEVQTAGGAVIKKVEMLYDYFSSGSTTVNIVSKRLKLLSVQETEGTNPVPKYVMEYSTVNLPDKDSYQQDYWGFYNGASGNDTKGTMLPPDAAAPAPVKLPVFSTPSIAGGADRNANAAFLTANMLTAMTNPLGGKTVYTWQGNTFSNGIVSTSFPTKSVSNFTGTMEIAGPGTRIGKIEYKDSDGTLKKQTQLEYQEPGTPIKTGKLMTSAIYVEIVDGGALYSSASRHPLGGSLQGNLIGYNQVVAFNGATRLAEGYSVYRYENLVDQSDYTTFCMSWGLGGNPGVPGPACSAQPILYSAGGTNCNPYTQTLPITTKSVGDISMPNIVHDLNGSLLEETYFNASNNRVRSTLNTHESKREQLLQNYRLKITDGITFGLSYQIERVWNRILESKTLVYDQDGDINHYSQTVTEYTYGTSYPFAAKTVSTDSKSGAAKVSITVAGQPVSVYDRQIETSMSYPYDLSDATSISMKDSNIVSTPVETTVKLAVVSGGAQVFTPLQYQKTTYNGLPFFTPQKIESKRGAAATATTDASFLTYDTRGNLLTYKERDGITQKLDYYGTGDAGKTDLVKTRTTADGSLVPQATGSDYTVLVGVQGITDPNAKTINYDYDDKNRIKTIKNPDGKARASYCYNYAGQVVDCATLAPFGSIAASDTILIYELAATPLPVNLLEFNAVKAEKTTQLSWSTTAETNSERFEIERSPDGKQWVILGTAPAKGESSTLLSYAFNDTKPASGENLYRLKMIDKDGTFAYSRIKSVVFDQSGQLTLYPNPITIGENLNLSIDDLTKISSIRIFDTAGKLVQQSGASRQISTAQLSLGLYMVQITYTDGSLSTHRVVKQ